MDENQVGGGRKGMTQQESRKTRRKRSRPFVSSMSMVRNSEKLFSDYEDNVNKTLSFVHGARVWFTLFLTWINLWVYNAVFIPSPTGT